MPKYKKSKDISRRQPWNERYNQLVQFKEKNGHCKVHRHHPQLGIWVMTQCASFNKKKEGTLSSDQIKSLEDIGFEWVVSKVVSWDERFEELKAYKKEHKHCNVPQRFKDNPQLGSWVNTQRQAYKKGKLSPDQIKLLEGIGFEWELYKVMSWDERFEELKQYKDKNGHCNVSSKDKDNKQLGKWVSHQRTAYQKGKLLKERIESLKRLGFKWVLGSGRRPAREVSDASEDSVSGGEEEAGGATSSGDTQMMIPSLSPLPEVFEDVADAEGSPSGEDKETGGDKLMIPMPQLPPIAEDTDNTLGGETVQAMFGVGNIGEDVSLFTNEDRGDNHQGGVMSRVNGGADSLTAAETEDSQALLDECFDETLQGSVSLFMNEHRGEGDNHQGGIMSRINGGADSPTSAGTEDSQALLDFGNNNGEEDDDNDGNFFHMDEDDNTGYLNNQQGGDQDIDMDTDDGIQEIATEQESNDNKRTTPTDNISPSTSNKRQRCLPNPPSLNQQIEQYTGGQSSLSNDADHNTPRIDETTNETVHSQGIRTDENVHDNDTASFEEADEGNTNTNMSSALNENESTQHEINERVANDDNTALGNMSYMIYRISKTPILSSALALALIIIVFAVVSYSGSSGGTSNQSMIKDINNNSLDLGEATDDHIIEKHIDIDTQPCTEINQANLRRSETHYGSNLATSNIPQEDVCFIEESQAPMSKHSNVAKDQVLVARTNISQYANADEDTLEEISEINSSLDFNTSAVSSQEKVSKHFRQSQMSMLSRWLPSQDGDEHYSMYMHLREEVQTKTSRSSSSSRPIYPNPKPMTNLRDQLLAGFSKSNSQDEYIMASKRDDLILELNKAAQVMSIINNTTMRLVRATEQYTYGRDELKIFIWLVAFLSMCIVILAIGRRTMSNSPVIIGSNIHHVQIGQPQQPHEDRDRNNQEIISNAEEEVVNEEEVVEEVEEDIYDEGWAYDWEDVASDFVTAYGNEMDDTVTLEDRPVQSIEFEWQHFSVSLESEAWSSLDSEHQSREVNEQRQGQALQSMNTIELTQVLELCDRRLDEMLDTIQSPIEEETMSIDSSQNKMDQEDDLHPEAKHLIELYDGSIYRRLIADGESEEKANEIINELKEKCFGILD